MANKMLRELNRLQYLLEDIAEKLNELGGKLYDAKEGELGAELGDAADVTDRVARMVAQVRSTLLVEGLE